MPSYSTLCRELFLLAQHAIDSDGPARGWHWERRVADYLGTRNVPVEALPGGIRIFGHASASGLGHQIDGVLACRDALVVGEWKAHRRSIPKNELLRFKAVTDDHFTAMPGSPPRKPVMRVFGGTGRATRPLRTYAAMHGITVIEPTTWPAPVLAESHGFWPSARSDPPTEHDRRHLAWLSRPIQSVLVAQPDGAFLIPPPMSSSMIESALNLQDQWSDRLWEAFDESPGTLEALLPSLPIGEAA